MAVPSWTMSQNEPLTPVDPCRALGKVTIVKLRITSGPDICGSCPPHWKHNLICILPLHRHMVSSWAKFLKEWSLHHLWTLWLLNLSLILYLVTRKVTAHSGLFEVVSALRAGAHLQVSILLTQTSLSLRSQKTTPMRSMPSLTLLV